MVVCMTERSQNRKSLLFGPYVPVPISPFQTVYDMWSSDTVESALYNVIIPDDGMVYTLCNFTVISNTDDMAIAAVALNTETIYYNYCMGSLWWSPGASKGPKFKAGDIIGVGLTNGYYTLHNWYWQMDFFRDPI